MGQGIRQEGGGRGEWGRGELGRGEWGRGTYDLVLCREQGESAEEASWLGCGVALNTMLGSSAKLMRGMSWKSLRRPAAQQQRAVGQYVRGQQNVIGRHVRGQQHVIGRHVTRSVSCDRSSLQKRI